MTRKTIKKTSEIKNSDYKELVDFLAVKFDEVNSKLDQKADKSEVDAIKSEVAAVLDRVVRMSDKLDDYRAGQLGLERQVEKHEKWHFATAAKIGLKLRLE